MSKKCHRQILDIPMRRASTTATCVQLTLFEFAPSERHKIWIEVLNHLYWIHNDRQTQRQCKHLDPWWRPTDASTSVKGRDRFFQCQWFKRRHAWHQRASKPGTNQYCSSSTHEEACCWILVPRIPVGCFVLLWVVSSPVIIQLSSKPNTFINFNFCRNCGCCKGYKHGCACQASNSGTCASCANWWFYFSAYIHWTNACILNLKILEKRPLMFDR